MITLPQSIIELHRENSHLNNSDSVLNWSGAVNLIILEKEIVFIKRSEDVPTHKGQIGFMGGHKMEKEDPIECALREFNEESSLNSNQLKPLGLLGPVQTSIGSTIIPVLSHLNVNKLEFFNKIQSNGEWDEVFSIKIENFFKLDRWVNGIWKNHQGDKGNILFYPIEKSEIFTINELKNEDYLLWGVTAQIVWNFLKVEKKLSLP